jgi:sialic acid synthase SpsE
LFVVKNVEAGEAFTSENVRSIRPGHGLAPKYLKEVLGKRAVRKLKPGTPLDWDSVAR